MAQWLNWGDGHSGSPNSISGTINTYATCTGTAGQTSLTTALSASAGDQILIHQSQGTGAGLWEICKVTSDEGATLNLATALVNSYGTGAQAVLIPQYTGGDISGAVTGTAWNGSVGGIIALMSNGDLTISGSINATGIGFRGGAGRPNNNDTSVQGEGYAGTGTTSGAANGSGGGGGYTPNTGSPGMGGGGGHATAGGRSAYNVNGSTSGYGGEACGIAALTTMFFGGGGGGATMGGSSTGKVGGGIVFIIAKNFTLSGTIPCNGVSASDTFAGCGAGGSVLIKTQVAVLGTNKITASGGTNFQGWENYGAAGRIRVDYFTSVEGSTTPTLSSAQDNTLNVAGGSGFFAFF